MKKVIFAIGFIALISACTSTVEETATTTDSTAADTAAVVAEPTVVVDTVGMPDSIKAEMDTTTK